jgi:hypothetical protein
MPAGIGLDRARLGGRVLRDEVHDGEDDGDGLFNVD